MCVCVTNVKCSWIPSNLLLEIPSSPSLLPKLPLSKSLILETSWLIVTIVTVDPCREASSSSSSSLPRLRHHHFSAPLVVFINATSPNLYRHQHYFAWSFIIIIVPRSSLSLSSSIGIILHHDFGEDWFRFYHIDSCNSSWYCRSSFPLYKAKQGLIPT